MMQKSQSLLEYATIIAVVAAALMAMHVYVQRATQSNLRLIEDRIPARQTIQPDEPGPTPTCKPNPCSTYKDCTDVSGDCSSGHPCSGTCDPIAPIIPPGAEEWVWGYPRFYLDNNQEKTFWVDISSTSNLVVWVFGLSLETNGTFTWQYPDGQIFNSLTPILGVSGAGVLKLDSVPVGIHIFTIKSNAYGSYFVAKIDVL